ncbi:MAG: hypothetical protein WCK35_27780 [Chloroflexota bacterium]
MKKILLVTVILVLILSGCSLPGAAATSPTMDAKLVMTAAAATAFAQLSATAGVSTPTASATITPEPATITPTSTVEVKLVPVEALCTYLATVRSRPSKGGDSLGFVAFNHKAQVLARNNNGTWYYIDWPDAPTGKAWVIAQAFTLVSSDVTRLPIAMESNGNIILLPPVIWEIKGTPLPLPTADKAVNARTAVAFEGFSLRVCPSKGCMVLGMLHAGDVVTLTGRYGKNEWAQILFPSGPDGKAWVIGTAFQPNKALYTDLPLFDLLGNLITPEPPTGTPDPNASATPAPTKTPKSVWPLAEITGTTDVYGLMSSFSPIIGTLKSKDKIHVTARSINGLWLEIQYPLDDAKGRGYISVKYVRLLGDLRYLPYTDAVGTPIPTP